MRRHPLGNKPWKKELHHQESALDKKLREEASMEEKKEGRRSTKLKDEVIKNVDHEVHSYAKMI